MGAAGYRPRFGKDIRIKPDAPVQTHEPRPCSARSCKGEGAFRVPKARDRLDEHLWFCLEHARKHNEHWDYFNGMSEAEMAGYKLIIIPGGNSIEIGQSLTINTASSIRGAVTLYGTHYLGICAGAFFGGSSIYNGVGLTGGVAFDFYADEYKGIHIEPVEITRPNDVPLDVYWQDGPHLSGWGAVVAKFPDGTPAIVQGQSGKGFVVFTGVHLEAPETWRGSMIFTTPVDVDLAYAATVFQSALKGTPLPHF